MTINWQDPPDAEDVVKSIALSCKETALESRLCSTDRRVALQALLTVRRVNRKVTFHQQPHVGRHLWQGGGTCSATQVNLSHSSGVSPQISRPSDNRFEFMQISHSRSKVIEVGRHATARYTQEIANKRSVEQCEERQMTEERAKLEVKSSDATIYFVSQSPPWTWNAGVASKEKKITDQPVVTYPSFANTCSITPSFGVTTHWDKIDRYPLRIKQESSAIQSNS